MGSLCLLRLCVCLVAGLLFNILLLTPCAQAQQTIVNSGADPTQTVNVDPIYTPRLATCLARVKANQGNCYIALIGASVTYGLFSDDDQSSWYGDFTAHSPAADLVSLLKSSGIPATYGAWFGNQHGGPTVNISGLANDGRVSLGTSWSNAPFTYTLGGRPIQSSLSATSDNLSFTPLDPIDTCYFIFLGMGGLDTATIAMTSEQGTATANFSTSIDPPTPGRLVSTSLTNTRGINTCRVKDSASPYGYGLYMAGMVGIDSTQSQVVILNMAWSGSTTGNWTYNDGQTWQLTDGGLGQLPFQIDAALLEGGIGNNIITSVDLNTTKQQLQTEITSIQQTGADVILITDEPLHPNIVAYDKQQQYYQVMFDLAMSNNLPFLDMYRQWGSTFNASLTGPDGIHPNAKGYFQEAVFWDSNLLWMGNFRWLPGGN